MRTLLLTLILLTSFTAFSQKNDAEHNDRIKALKVAHITEEVNLTPKEAQQFWPVYNVFTNTMSDMRQKRKQLNKSCDSFSTLNEVESKEVIDNTLHFKQNEAKLFSKLVSDLKPFLSNNKILLVLAAEESFKRKMFNEFKARHRNKKD